MNKMCHKRRNTFLLYFQSHKLLYAGIFLFFLTACSKNQPDAIIATATNPPSKTNTISPTLTGTPIPTTKVLPTDTPTIIPTQSPTFTISPTLTPTPSPTPPGGGTGLIQIRFRYEGVIPSEKIFSLTLNSILEDMQLPIFFREEETEGSQRKKITLYDPTTGDSKLIYECPTEYQDCTPNVIHGSPSDEWIYLVSRQSDQEGFGLLDLVQVNTATEDQRILEQFSGVGLSFKPFPTELEGLLAVDWVRDFESDLYIYNLETQTKQLLLSDMGSFRRYGFSPDQEFIWYRITDNCEIDIIGKDGNQISLIPNADEILGWIDSDNFLVVTSDNNPPNCTRNGIAIANIDGYTGEWIMQGIIGDALLSPDGTRIIYLSDCSNIYCKKLMMLNLDENDPITLYDSEEEMFWIDWLDE